MTTSIGEFSGRQPVPLTDCFVCIYCGKQDCLRAQLNQRGYGLNWN